jgi:hypothetical protein
LYLVRFLDPHESVLMISVRVDLSVLVMQVSVLLISVRFVP